VTPQNWQTVMTKKGRHFFRKIGVTPSVATSGDTKPSDATEWQIPTEVHWLSGLRSAKNKNKIW